MGKEEITGESRTHAPYSEAQAKAVGDRISEALAAAKKGAPKRHPLEVTSDRIADAIYKHHDRLDGAERDALSRARDILERLAEGDDA